MNSIVGKHFGLYTNQSSIFYLRCNCNVSCRGTFWTLFSSAEMSYDDIDTILYTYTTSSFATSGRNSLKMNKKE